MDITEVSILHHIGIVLVVLCILSSYGICHPFIYFLSFIYLYQVNGCYTLKLRKRLHFEERKQANQRRLLSDSETVRWLNHAVEKIWPICMEQIVSQKILLPIMPWFLDKYKPWTAAEAAVQSLYMGRNPPMFTEVRVLRQSADDDHLVLELGMNFLTADDMSSVLAVKLKKRLGFGIWTKMHITGMHIEGKVLVGVKFLRHWPFLGRLRVCFVEPPYFQMTVKPIFNHGLDVTELPGVAGWLDKLLAVAFEQTLVEPNMLVVDVEKFASEPTGTSESWFKMDEKCPIAFAKVEVIEAADLKPADLNGLADPYVKGQFGLYKFRTKTQKKTLTPQWQEEYKIPIHSWESLNTLLLEVNDQDHFVDDTLGDCSINISDFRGGKRHDKWLPLRNIKMGRLHLAVTVLEVGQEGVPLGNTELPNEKENANLSASEAAQQDSNPTVSSGKVTKLADEFEPINIEGQQQTGIWVLHPGSDVCQTWEPRKREGKRSEIEILKEGHNSLNSSGPLAAGSRHSDSSDELENPGGTRFSTIKKNLRKIGSIFHSHPRNENLDDREASPLPHINLHDVHEKKVGVKFVVDDENVDVVRDQKSEGGSVSSEKSEAGSPHKGHMKGMRKKMLNKAQSVKRALSKKEMHKGKGGLVPSAGTEVEVPLEFDSSEKGSPQSSKEYISIESIPIAPSTSSDDCKESPIANEENVQLGPLLTRDNMECVARKASFHGADGVDGDVECHEEPLVKVSSFRDAARIDDEAGRGKFLDTKLSNEGGGRTDGAVRDHTDEQVQTVEASFILQASEGT